ncbi:MAG TPA: hypothetical protein VGI39_21725 [Polyangiaceae bacterium]|jgi:hypothetical protein
MNTLSRLSLVSFVSLPITLMIAACSSSTPRTGTEPQPNAAPDSASPCKDADKPECLLGGPCSCDDVASNDGVPLCVAGGWQCPAGYTRFQDCEGVPPGPSCFKDGGPDAPDSSCPAATKPECVQGGPCSCDDVASDDGVPVCSAGTWSCPAGYTRFEDCLGIPPGPLCHDGGGEGGPNTSPDGGGDASQ